MDYLATKVAQKLALTRNPIVVLVDPVPLPLNASRVDLRYFLELKVQSSFQSSTYISLPIQEASEKPIPADYANSPGAYFEVQTRLDDQMKATPPIYGDTAISVCPDLTRQFYYVTERYNDDALVDSSQSTARWAFRGAISMRHYSGYKDSFFTDVIGKEGRFLTWQPDGKFVMEDQPERLYFLTNFAPLPAVLRVRVKAQYADGTTETFTAVNATNITPMTVYGIPAGFSCLQLNKKAKVVNSYQVWISNQDNERVSEIRSFRVDRQDYESVRYIIFQNSLGGYDTLRCVGSPSETFAVERQIVERYNDYDYLPTVSDVLINSVTGQRMIKLNTGNWINEQYREYMEDLLLSEEFFIVDNEEFVPIIPGFSELLTNSVSEWPIERTLSFTYANPVGGFSRLPKITAVSRPTAWRQFAESCEINESGLRTGKKIVNQIARYYLDSGELVRPLETKPNVPGAEGYVEPWLSLDCAAVTTPFKNTVASRISSKKRNNCGAGKIGSAWTMSVAAGLYGSEISQIDADAKAAVALTELDTQAAANLYGGCVSASRVKVALLNNCQPATPTTPVPSVWVGSTQIIPNTTNNTIRYATVDYGTGVYTFDVIIMYSASPFIPCKIKIPSRNLESPVMSGKQTHRFANLPLTFGDPDLIIVIEPA